MPKVKAARYGVKLDLLCFEVLETDAGGVVEEALRLNPGLAERLGASGYDLALDEVVVLPEPRSTPPTIAQIKLWD
jgi:phage tail protein X